MKKKIFLGLLTLAGAGMLASCQQDEQITAPVQSPSQLQVRATIGSRTLTRGIKTGTAFDEGDMLGLYVTSQDGSALYNATSGNVKATKVGAGWTLGQSIALSSTAGKVYAYYPYSDTEGSAIADMSSISVAPGDVDYMWGISGDVTASNPQADIEMKHALSCLVVKFSNQGSPNGCVISATSFQNVGASVFYDDGKMDITSGAVSLGTAANQSYAEDANFKASTVSLQHLILPSGKDISEGDCKFVFTIDGKQYAYSVPALEQGYKAGYKYTYTFVMKGSDLVLDDDDPDGNGGITITPWEDGSTIDGGIFE